MEVAKVKVSDIRWGGELAGEGYLLDGEAEPIIVEDVGSYFDLIDGYHRLGAMIDSGEQEVTAVIVDEEDCAECNEFGGPPDAMDEEEWIEWVQEEAAELLSEKSAG